RSPALTPLTCPLPALTRAYPAYLSLTCTYPRLPELPDDPVLYPMPIPPFDGVHGLALEEHRVVQVIAAGEAGDARAADFGAAFDGVADVGRDRREVAVE